MSWLLRMRERFRYVIGGGPKGPLLIRYRLVSTRWGGIYLHHLMRSDADRHLHDHPWAFWSLILWRGYVELEPKRGQGAPGIFAPNPYRREEQLERVRMTWRPPLGLVRHRATDRHRLQLLAPAWSLIWIGPRVREWGFHTEHGWIPWQDYVA